MTGDPTGSGAGGNSIWDKPFKDEFNQHLSHTGRGILSMANSGPNTNKSQFFITFRSCKHLDKKHSVFGRVVGGIETLDKMERIETDAKDKPKEPIFIKKVVTYVDPFKEIDDVIEAEREKAKQAALGLGSKTKEKTETAPKQFRTGVGSFIDLSTLSSAEGKDDSGHQTGTESSSSSSIENKKKKSKQLGDFSTW
jgi:peptidyl-prolyl cis-trans isomerase-like protein 2